MPSTPIFDKLARPLKDLRISVTDRCNFRCNYCMPSKTENVYSFARRKDILSYEEISRLVRIFASLGVTKVRLTGGEPLLRPGLKNLINQISNIPEIEDIALTTNGSLLGDLALELKQAGLNRLTISLDTLNAAILKRIAGNSASLSNILNGIKAAETAGFSPIKINAVIQKKLNQDSILNLVKYFRATPHILRFIEYMDVGNCNQWKMDDVVSFKDIQNEIERIFPLIPLEKNYPGEVANRYKFIDTSGEIGFISSITKPFCSECTRARVSTDGKIFTCLFAENGFDLKFFLRNNHSDNEIKEIISNVWSSREDRYSEIRAQFHKSHSLSTEKIEMFQIGG